MNIDKYKIPLISDEEMPQLVRKMLAIFNEYNPAVWYGNKTYRKAIEDLLQRMWPDNLVDLFNEVFNFQWKDYAPTVTNPYELSLKMSKIINYINKHG